MKTTITLSTVFAIILGFVLFKRHNVSQENKELKTEITATQEINDNLRETTDKFTYLLNYQRDIFYDFIDCGTNTTDEVVYDCLKTYLDKADSEYKRILKNI